MKKTGKYNTSGLVEAQYEPGTRGHVLKNLRGIKSKPDMEMAETLEYKRVTDVVIEQYDQDHRFTASDICHMHKIWLGSIYQWAGCYRNVMMSKGSFSFAAPRYLPILMEDLEKTILSRYTPCNFESIDDVVESLAIVHTELILIHPFREGNGRLARLLSAIMAMQAGLPFLDFSHIKGKWKEEYFAAVRAGLDRNYKPMESVFSEVVSLTLKKYKQE